MALSNHLLTIFLEITVRLFFFWPHHAACGILVPGPGVEPGPSSVRAQSPNHWTAREVPHSFFFFFFDCIKPHNIIEITL